MKIHEQKNLHYIHEIQGIFGKLEKGNDSMKGLIVYNMYSVIARFV